MTTINLIAGEFNPVEAREILLKLVDTKINFHKVQSLSTYIHYGHSNIDSEDRIKELKEAKEQINALVQRAIETNSNIEVGSTIDIALKAKVQPETFVQDKELVASI